MVFQIHAYRLVPERQYLVRQLSTFQANQSVGQRVDLFFLYILADELYRMTAAYKYHSSIPTEFTYRIQPV